MGELYAADLEFKESRGSQAMQQRQYPRQAAIQKYENNYLSGLINS